MTDDAPANAAPFTAMAERIVLNKDQDFGGAFVIVPPKEGGDPVNMLILDNMQSSASFWGTLKSTCEIAIQELSEKQQRQKTGWR